MSALQQVFAAVSGGSSATNWDPSNKAAGVTLSNGNKTLTNASGASSYIGARSLSQATISKIYFELTVSSGYSVEFGVCNSSWAFTSLRSPTTNSNGFNTGGNNGVFGFAADLTNKLMWRTDNTGAFTGSPSAGTGGTSFIFSAPFYMGATVFDDGGSFITNFGASAFAYTPPSGFTAWR